MELCSKVVFRTMERSPLFTLFLRLDTDIIKKAPDLNSFTMTWRLKALCGIWKCCCSTLWEDITLSSHFEIIRQHVLWWLTFLKITAQKPYTPPLQGVTKRHSVCGHEKVLRYFPVCRLWVINYFHSTTNNIIF